MSVFKFQDRYNDLKVWIVKRYADGHYYLNQSIAGQISGKFVRVRKGYIKNILEV